MKRKIWHFGIVAALFLLSLLPRIKNIQTGDFPAVIPHLQVLQTIQVWESDSPQAHAFLPIQTWSNPNDKFITYFQRLQNEKGNNYYVSYPPFAFILAYVFCNIFGLSYSVLSITILNLLLQFIAAWCVFKIARKLIPDKENEFLFWPGIAAAAIFICNPASMRLYSQVYFSESVGTTLLCIFIYFAICVTQNPRGIWNLIKMAIVLFILVYTEWVGLFAAAIFGIFWFAKSIRNPSFRGPFFALIFFSLSAVLLFAYQLDLITGSGDFIANLKERYLARSGMRDKEKSVGDTVFKDGFWEWFFSTFRVTLYAVRWFFPLLIVAAILFFRKRKADIQIPKLSYGLFFGVFVIVFINFFALFNFSLIHSYTWAKWGLPIALLTAWSVHVLIKNKAFKLQIIVFMAAFFATDLIFYTDFGKIDAAPKYWEQQTEFIKKEARSNETIYITTVSDEVDPTFHLTYYTGRNMMNVLSEADADSHAKKIGRKNYVWFDFNQKEKPNGGSA